MILIGGTQLEVSELPFNEVLNYVVETKKKVLEIKLKTVAKGNDCQGVYLHSSQDSIPLTEEVMEKVIYYNSDSHLFSLLENGGKEVPEEEVATPVEEQVQEVPEPVQPTQPIEEPVVFTPPEEVSVEVSQPSAQGGKSNLFIFEEADTDIPDNILELPLLAEDTDSVREQLDHKQKVIEQKDAEILELNQKITETYKIQETTLSEMKKKHEEVIFKAEEAIKELEKQLKEQEITEAQRIFLKYAEYSKNPKALLREQFTEGEIKHVGGKSSNIYILAGGAGDSVHSYLGQLKKKIDGGSQAVIVDFSNDYYLNASYKIHTRDSSLLLNDETKPVSSLVKEINKASIIPTTFYNDIALLHMDWTKVLQRIKVYAGNRPIVFLFNNINSFAVRYTVSKLSSAGSLYVFAKSNPVVLATMIGDLSFIPKERLRIVVVNYIEVVKPLLETMSKSYPVYVHEETVNWGKMQLNI